VASSALLGSRRHPGNPESIDEQRGTILASEEDVWYIPEYLGEIAHTALLTAAQIQRLSKMDRRLFEAGKHGSVEH